MMVSLVYRAGLAGVLLIVATTCGDAASTSITVDGVTRSERADTTVVFTDRPGQWGPPRDAVEVLRVAADTPETTFGAVFVIAATPDGGVLVLDSKAPDGVIIRQFDANGKFVRNIGRRGNGPGEYSSGSAITFTTHTDGTILVRDGRRMVNRYAADGTFISGFAPGYGSTLEIYAATDGSIMMRGPFPRGRGAAMSAVPPIIRHAPDGRIIDSIANPRPWLTTVAQSQYEPTAVWFPLRDRRIVHMRTDKMGFLLIDPAGATKPLIGEAAATTVDYLPDEHAELVRIADWQQQRLPQEARTARVEIPKAKLPVKSWGFEDYDGRIWIWRSTTAQKIAPRLGARSGSDSILVTYDEPRVFAVFQLDGTFLGEVRFPVGVYPAITGNAAWGVVPGQDDEPILVKFRIPE